MECGLLLVEDWSCFVTHLDSREKGVLSLHRQQSIATTAEIVNVLITATKLPVESDSRGERFVLEAVGGWSHHILSHEQRGKYWCTQLPFHFQTGSPALCNRAAHT